MTSMTNFIKAAGPAPGRPKRARIPSGDRPVYTSGEGQT